MLLAPAYTVNILVFFTDVSWKCRLYSRCVMSIPFLFCPGCLFFSGVETNPFSRNKVSLFVIICDRVPRDLNSCFVLFSMLIQVIARVLVEDETCCYTDGASWTSRLNNRCWQYSCKTLRFTATLTRASYYSSESICFASRILPSLMCNRQSLSSADRSARSTRKLFSFNVNNELTG